MKRIAIAGAVVALSAPFVVLGLILALAWATKDDEPTETYGRWEDFPEPCTCKVVKDEETNSATIFPDPDCRYSGHWL